MGFSVMANCKRFANRFAWVYVATMSQRLCSTLLLLFGTIGCGSGTEPGRLKVVTTSLPIYCFTDNVAGDLASVENLLPANVSPHDYQLTPQDARKLSGARLAVASGLGLEDWLDRVLKGQHAPVVEASAGLGNGRIGSDDRHDHGAWNPHFWLDPVLAAHAVTNIMRALQDVDPANAQGYARNAAV